MSRQKQKHTCTAPVLSFKLCDKQGQDPHVIQLWIGDAGEAIPVNPERRSFIFGMDAKSGSLVYEEQHHGHYATEYNVWNESTWQWIAKWMERGLLAEGYMRAENSRHWQRSETIGETYAAREGAPIEIRKS